MTRVKHHVDGTDSVKGPRPVGPPLFLAWSAAPGRLHDMATATGGVARQVYHVRLVRRWLLPLRYLLSLFETARHLSSLRPRVAVITNPPIFPAVVAWMYCRLTGAELVLDSHTASFGTQGNRWMSPRPLHSWLARRARCTLVGTDHWRSLIRAWGGRPLVFHEPPTSVALPAASSVTNRSVASRSFAVLFVNVFANDEPTAEVIDAAGRLPDVHFRVTGDLRKAPPSFASQLPSNVELLGFLDQEAYWLELQRADAILTLTTEDTSVMRSACEATSTGRPVVTSDTTVARECFPHACRTRNDGPAIAEALSKVREEHERWTAEARRGAALQAHRMEAQLAELRQILGVDRP